MVCWFVTIRLANIAFFYDFRRFKHFKIILKYFNANKLFFKIFYFNFKTITKYYFLKNQKNNLKNLTSFLFACNFVTSNERITKI
ncbi:MAG: hypothetical protein RLZZ292_1327 [Bacteroidota bacterium]|jgi:hypothetical protein